MARVICRTHNHYVDSKRSIVFEEARVQVDGAFVYLGVADVADPASLDFYRAHPSFEVLEDAAESDESGTSDPDTGAGGESTTSTEPEQDTGSAASDETIDGSESAESAESEIRVPVVPTELLKMAPAQLEDAVAQLEDVEVIRSLIDRDRRKPARAVYRARLRVLDGTDTAE